MVSLGCYGPSVISVPVTKTGLTGTSGHDGRSGTMGRGLSELRGLGLVCTGSLVYRNVNVLS